VPVAYAAEWARLVPGARVEVIDGCGHLPAIERPSVLADIVARFL